MDDFERLLSEYDYEYPEDAVALVPAEPRDAARLMVYDPDADTVEFDVYRNVGAHLPPRSCLVFNETKVIPARVEARKPTGGKVRVLYLRTVGPASFAALADRPMAVGSEVTVGDTRLSVDSVADGEYRLTLTDGQEPLVFFNTHGIMPLPPYLKKTPLGEGAIRDRYQTVFAKNIGSVAAPTASLHFTPELLERLRAAGHEIVFVTLHVNIGTFLPLKPQQVESGHLHAEEFTIPAETALAVSRAKREGRPVIAVGTTVVRALESGLNPAAGDAKEIRGSTSLFIRPGYEPKVVDGLITNFHVPKSSLMMLVAAFVGRERLIALYRQAIASGFRLFSFGDGMLILPRCRPSA